MDWLERVRAGWIEANFGHGASHADLLSYPQALLGGFGEPHGRPPVFRGAVTVLVFGCPLGGGAKLPIRPLSTLVARRLGPPQKCLSQARILGRAPVSPVLSVPPVLGLVGGSDQSQRVVESVRGPRLRVGTPIFFGNLSRGRRPICRASAFF